VEQGRKIKFLKILSRITEPSNGRISIKGRVASLLERGTGFHELTGRENVYLPLLGMTRLRLRKFDEIVFWESKVLDGAVKHYSSGMYVRLPLLLAHLEPEILIVDEV